MQVFGWPRSLLRAGGYGAVELSPEGRARLRAEPLAGERECEIGLQHIWGEPGHAVPLAEAVCPPRPADPAGAHAPAAPGEAAHVVARAGEGGLAASGAVPPGGERQAGGPASTRGVGDLGLDGGPHPGRSQAPATAGRAEGQGGEREAASGAAALRHAQAQGLCARPSRRPGPGGHPRAFPPCRGEVEAIHRPGHGLALGRDGGLLVRHGPLRSAVFGHPSGARSVPAAGDSGGRGLGVPGGVRGACAEREILLFELPPRSPKLNGRVERANRTHTEEFYEVYELPWTVASLNVRLREWEQVYNHIRPHWALDYLTPAQVLETFKKTAPVSHMS